MGSIFDYNIDPSILAAGSPGQMFTPGGLNNPYNANSFGYNDAASSLSPAEQMMLYGGTLNFTNPIPSPAGVVPSMPSIDFGGGRVLDQGLVNQIFQRYGNDIASQMIADELAYKSPLGGGTGESQMSFVNPISSPSSPSTFTPPPPPPPPPGTVQSPPAVGAPSPVTPSTNAGTGAGSSATGDLFTMPSPGSPTPGGGGGGAPGSSLFTMPNFSLPFNTNAFTIPPSGSTTPTPPAGVGTPPGGNINQFLANLAPNIGYLEGIAANAGYPINVMPAWQAMIEAQQRNINRNAADIEERFNVMGGRFSSPFGQAMNDYYQQTTRDQNALLAEMTRQALEAAAGRELQASGQLGQYAFAGPSQLSGQEFQSGQQQLMASLQAALQASGGADQAANLLASFGNQAGMGLNQNALQAAIASLGAENQAALSLYGGQMGLLPSLLSHDVQLRGLGLQGAGNLSDLWRQNLLAGLQIGGTQYGLGQGEIDRQYQEWLRTQPMYNPLMQYLFAGATGYPPTYQPQYAPSQLPGILSGLGGIMGGLPAFLRLFGIGQ